MREELLQERKKAIYGLICDELYVPMKAKEIAAVLNVPKSDRRDLTEVLDALVAEGKVEVSSKGKYMKSEGKFLTGVFTAHPREFGFVTVEGEDEDIFIPESQVNGAFHGDTVQVALTRARGARTAQRGADHKDSDPRGQPGSSVPMKKARHSGSQCRTIRDLDRIFLSRRSAPKGR